MESPISIFCVNRLFRCSKQQFLQCWPIKWNQREQVTVTADGFGGCQHKETENQGTAESPETEKVTADQHDDPDELDSIR